jgi:phage tail-like protein
MPEYPLPKFHFQVEWGGTNISFTEVTGLEVTTEKLEYRGGASPEYNKLNFPGMQTYGDLTLKRGVFAGITNFTIGGIQLPSTPLNGEISPSAC